ncbi:MAG: HAMP domain-containing histidine kinase [Synechococcus sp. BS307-5m-G38]|nr:HAMP domain-containing histidine kinase [Synechococcus sp. BS307-5m-G38]
MASPQSWRRQLLGSLQGQLQLATYLAVFVGFTGASLAGLWIGQRSLIEDNAAELRRSADAIQLSLRKGSLADDKLRQELRLHSSLRTTLWLEQPNGALVLPQNDHLQISDAAIQAAMTANPERLVGQQHLIRPGDNLYLSELVERFPSGAGLWINHEFGSNQQALSHYLGLMIVIWGSCLTITLLAMSALVRRIVQPLQELNAATDAITAETLASARLSVSQGPIEVIQLAGTYNALLERLSQSWGLQRQFVSAVSHELRTPLTIVQGYLHRTIRRSDNLSDAQIKGLQTAEEESIRMRRLLDDLLDLSRSDSGRLSIDNEPVRLMDQLEQVVDLARSALNRPLELTLPDQDELRDVVVQADPSRLRQVLLDLIENADKYSAPGLPIRLALRSADAMACIDVIDQGIGIPPDELDQVFERFQRGSNAPEKTGSGLGLSVVQLLVEGMGGSIEVSSRLGEGSCFTVRLPK